MFGPPFSEEEIGYAATLLEERVNSWTFPFKERRRIEAPVSFWDFPEADKEHHFQERDVLNGVIDKKVVLSIPNREERKLPYVMYALSRHLSANYYGTQKIDCERIVVGDPRASSRIVLKERFPHFDFAKKELEDAGVWGIHKENPGWHRCSEDYESKAGDITYRLDIFDDEEWNPPVIIPTDAIFFEGVPVNIFDKISEMLGKKVSIDDFADECVAFYPKGTAPHELEVTKFSMPRKERTCLREVEADAYFGIYGTAGFDRTYPGGCLFRNGKVVYGGLGYNKIRSAEDFKKAITHYFQLPFYELFTLFFTDVLCGNLPESHREAIREIL